MIRRGGYDNEEIISPKNSLRTLLRYIREDPRTYGLGIFASIIVGFLDFAGITSLIPVIASLLGEPISGALTIIAQYVPTSKPVIVGFVFAFLILLQVLVSLSWELYFLRRVAKWRTQLSLDYVRGIAYAHWNGLNKLRPGEMEVMLTRDIGLSMKLRHMTIGFLSESALAIVYIIAALFISLYASILFIALGVIFGLLQSKTLKLRSRLSVFARDKYRSIAGKVIEYFSDPRGIVISNKEAFLNRLRIPLQEAAYAQLRTDQINVFFKNFQQPLMLLLFAITAIVAVKLLHYPVSLLIGVFYVFFRASPKIINVGKGYGEIAEYAPVDVVPEIERWRQFSPKTKNVLPPQNTSIVFDDVYLGYNENEPLLQNVQLRVNPGELVCVVGKSGTGKSTILDVVCGFQAPRKGTVKLGSVDYGEVDWSAWRERLGLLRAEGVVVSGTWVENVAFLYDDPDDKRVEELLERVGLKETVVEAGGIHSPITARGANLSAGQRQRLLLARALYRDPQLLILDEPTSNLDVATEIAIYDLLLSLKGNMTILVVSHREQILKHADRVYEVTTSGNVREIVSHVALAVT